MVVIVVVPVLVVAAVLVGRTSSLLSIFSYMQVPMKIKCLNLSSQKDLG